MAITPIGERVLIKPYRQDEKTKGGIYIPESAKEKKKQGTVIAAGTFKDGKELPVKPGDIIIMVDTAKKRSNSRKKILSSSNSRISLLKSNKMNRSHASLSCVHI